MGKGTRSNMKVLVNKPENPKSHKIYAFLVLVLGIAIIALAFIVLFHVQKIEITGNEYSSRAEIADWVQNDDFSTNSIYVLIKKAIRKDEKLPYMEDVKITLKNPWTLKVEVKEKKIVGYMAGTSEYIYFDREGLVVVKDTVLRENIPYIEGMEVTDAVLYKTLPVKNKKIFEAMLETTQTLKKIELVPDRIVCDGSNIELWIGTVYAKLGSSNITDKVLQLPPLLEKLTGQEGTLHLEKFSSKNRDISFRKGERPQASPEAAPPVQEPQDGEEQTQE